MPESETPPATHGMTFLGSTRLYRDEVEELRVQVDCLRHKSALLERERSKYIDLFEHAPDAYLVTDPSGVIYEANLAAGALFDAEPWLLEGRSLIDFVTPRDAGNCTAFLEKMKRVGAWGAASAARVVLRVQPSGHSVLVVFARVTVVAGDGSEPIALRWTLRSFQGEAG